jgi:hypothetical protein
MRGRARQLPLSPWHRKRLNEVVPQDGSVRSIMAPEVLHHVRFATSAVHCMTVPRVQPTNLPAIKSCLSRSTMSALLTCERWPAAGVAAARCKSAGRRFPRYASCGGGGRCITFSDLCLKPRINLALNKPYSLRTELDWLRKVTGLDQTPELHSRERNALVGQICIGKYFHQSTGAGYDAS